MSGRCMHHKSRQVSFIFSLLPKNMLVYFSSSGRSHQRVARGLHMGCGFILAFGFTTTKRAKQAAYMRSSLTLFRDVKRRQPCVTIVELGICAGQFFGTLQRVSVPKEVVARAWIPRSGVGGQRFQMLYANDQLPCIKCGARRSKSVSQHDVLYNTLQF